MESNWRYDIARAGLVGLKIGLYARLVDFPDFWIASNKPRIGAGVWLFYWPDPEQLPEFLGSIEVSGQSFPYGWQVYPD